MRLKTKRLKFLLFCMSFVPTLSHSSLVLRIVGVPETVLSAEANKKKIFNKIHQILNIKYSCFTILFIKTCLFTLNSQRIIVITYKLII